MSNLIWFETACLHVIEIWSSGDQCGGSLHFYSCFIQSLVPKQICSFQVSSSFRSFHKGFLRFKVERKKNWLISQFFFFLLFCLRHRRRRRWRRHQRRRRQHRQQRRQQWRRQHQRRRWRHRWRRRQKIRSFVTNKEETAAFVHFFVKKGNPCCKKLLQIFCNFNFEKGGAGGELGGALAEWTKAQLLRETKIKIQAVWGKSLGKFLFQKL